MLAFRAKGYNRIQQNTSISTALLNKILRAYVAVIERTLFTIDDEKTSR